jgi:hypothetical protein
LAEVTKEQAEADAKNVLELSKKYQDSFYGLSGGPLFWEFDLKPAQKAFEKIDKIDKEIIPLLQPVIKDFAEKYGTDSMTVYNKFFDMGLKDIGDEVDYKFQQLYESVGNVKKSREESAKECLKNCETIISGFDFYAPTVRLDQMENAKKWLQMGHKFDPSNDEINKKLAGIDQTIAKLAKKMDKEIDAKKWAGNIKDFSGPGTISDLSKAAVEYFKQDRDWGKSSKKKIEVLAVAVRGQWEIAETNLFGQVTQWRLPIHLAVTDETLKKQNIAMVYELSILGKVGNPGSAPKSPPYDGFWVGDSWMMRLNKVPK